MRAPGLVSFAGECCGHLSIRREAEAAEAFRAALRLNLPPAERTFIEARIGRPGPPGLPDPPGAAWPPAAPGPPGVPNPPGPAPA